jgi:hypothetical protein
MIILIFLHVRYIFGAVVMIRLSLLLFLVALDLVAIPVTCTAYSISECPVLCGSLASTENKMRISRQIT